MTERQGKRESSAARIQDMKDTEHASPDQMLCLQYEEFSQKASYFEMKPPTM